MLPLAALRQELPSGAAEVALRPAFPDMWLLPLTALRQEPPSGLAEVALRLAFPDMWLLPLAALRQELPSGLAEVALRPAFPGMWVLPVAELRHEVPVRPLDLLQLASLFLPALLSTVVHARVSLLRVAVPAPRLFQVVFRSPPAPVSPHRRRRHRDQLVCR